MSVIADFSIPASDFVLGRAISETAADAVEIRKVIPTGDQTIPYVWVIGEDRAEFDAVLERSEELAGFDAVDEIEGRALYRVEWSPSEETFLGTVTDHEAVLQDVGVGSDAWTFQFRFLDSSALSEFHESCRDADIDITVERLYNPVDATDVDTREMTAAQRSLIERAYEEGYFEVPRQTTLVELAEELGVSDQSVNERLRRGLSALIASTLRADVSSDGE